MMNKHAYLIVAHNNWTILDILLKVLDDTRNDVFLVLDNKSVTGGGRTPVKICGITFTPPKKYILGGLLSSSNIPGSTTCGNFG